MTEDRLLFREAIVGRRCIVCDRTEAEAFEATGYGMEAHHGVRRQVLRRLGLPEWNPILALPTCAEPCHRQHTSRARRIPRDRLPAEFVAWCFYNNLGYELELEYPYEAAA